MASRRKGYGPRTLKYLDEQSRYMDEEVQSSDLSWFTPQKDRRLWLNEYIPDEWLPERWGAALARDDDEDEPEEINARPLDLFQIYWKAGEYGDAIVELQGILLRWASKLRYHLYLPILSIGYLLFDATYRRDTQPFLRDYITLLPALILLLLSFTPAPRQDSFTAEFIYAMVFYNVLPSAVPIHADALLMGTKPYSMEVYVSHAYMFPIYAAMYLLVLAEAAVITGTPGTMIGGIVAASFCTWAALMIAGHRESFANTYTPLEDLPSANGFYRLALLTLTFPYVRSFVLAMHPAFSRSLIELVAAVAFAGLVWRVRNVADGLFDQGNEIPSIAWEDETIAFWSEKGRNARERFRRQRMRRGLERGDSDDEDSDDDDGDEYGEPYNNPRNFEFAAEDRSTTTDSFSETTPLDEPPTPPPVSLKRPYPNQSKARRHPFQLRQQRTWYRRKGVRARNPIYWPRRFWIESLEQTGYRLALGLVRLLKNLILLQLVLVALYSLSTAVCVIAGQCDPAVFGNGGALAFFRSSWDGLWAANQAIFGWDGLIGRIVRFWGSWIAGLVELAVLWLSTVTESVWLWISEGFVEDFLGNRTLKGELEAEKIARTTAELLGKATASAAVRAGMAAQTLGESR